MKYIIICSLLFFSIKTLAQDNKGVALYYLIDTNQVCGTKKLWSIDSDYPYKYFTLEKTNNTYNGELYFVYNTKTGGKLYTKHIIKTMKLGSIKDLLTAAENNLNDRKNRIFFIEPLGGKYIAYQVKARIAKKANGDYQIIPKQDTSKIKKHDN